MSNQEIKLVRKCEYCNKPIKWNKTYGYQCSCGKIKNIK